MPLRSCIFRISAFFCLSAFFFSGCSTDLDSNADYKEVMVIYSILDPDQTTHYAKVNKAFLNTNSNALTIAVNLPDSTQYPDILEVKLQRLRPGPDSVVTIEYPMERFISTGKEQGTFFSGDQVMYRTTGTVILDPVAIYRVHATNTKTGLIASGATEILADFPNEPGRGLCIYQISLATAPNGNCFTQAQPSAYRPDLLGNRIKFHPASNARIYTVKLNFDFTETTNSVSQQKQVEWYVRNNFIHEGTSDPEIPLETDFLINNLRGLIDRSQDNATTTRQAGDVTVTVTGGSSSLESYFRVNNAFSIISQTRPEYDNIKNGTGLVASRRSKTARGFLTTEAINYLAVYNDLKFEK